MKPFDGRIQLGFTGAGRTGKGTLAKEVAHKLGLTFLPSHIVDTGKMMRFTGYTDQDGFIEVTGFQFAIMFGQIYQERALQLAGLGYVAERTTLDYIPYFVQKTGKNYPPVMETAYLMPAYQWAKENYTMIIHCPVEFRTEGGDPWKESDHEAQLTTDAIIQEYLNILRPTVRVLTVVGTPEERFAQVMEALKEHARRNCPKSCGE